MKVGLELLLVDQVVQDLGSFEQTSQILLLMVVVEWVVYDSLNTSPFVHHLDALLVNASLLNLNWGLADDHGLAALGSDLVDVSLAGGVRSDDKVLLGELLSKESIKEITIDLVQDVVYHKMFVVLALLVDSLVTGFTFVEVGVGDLDHAAWLSLWHSGHVSLIK